MIVPTSVTDEASDEAVDICTSSDSSNSSWADFGSSSSDCGHSPEVVPYF